jgi:hypothetical protein
MCSEFETVSNFYINRRKRKTERKNENKRKKEKRQFLLGRPVRKIAQQGVCVGWFPTQKASNRIRQGLPRRQGF